MQNPFERSEKGGHTVYARVGIWYNAETGHIHLTVPGSDWFHTTVNNEPGSKRYHANLFRKLARGLDQAGAPGPGTPPGDDDDEPSFL